MDETTFTGYDGNGYAVGDRVELHPATDLWIRGARYGVVESCSTWKAPPLIHVRLDATNKVVAGFEDTFRRIG